MIAFVIKAFVFGIAAYGGWWLIRFIRFAWIRRQVERKLNKAETALQEQVHKDLAEIAGRDRAFQEFASGCRHRDSAHNRRCRSPQNAYSQCATVFTCPELTSPPEWPEAHLVKESDERKMKAS